MLSAKSKQENRKGNKNCITKNNKKVTLVSSNRLGKKKLFKQKTNLTSFRNTFYFSNIK